jgi:hypothetical protein
MNHTFKKYFIILFSLVIFASEAMEIPSSLLTTLLNASAFLKSYTNEHFDYKQSVLIPAQNCENSWSAQEAQEKIGSAFDVKLCCENKHNAATVFRRLSIFSSGVFTDPFCRRPSSLLTEGFSRYKNHHFNTYPGDFFIFNLENSGLKTSQAIGSLSFGQKDAFRLIFSLKKLKDNGLSEIDIDALCYGTLRVVHSLGLLSLPHEYPGAISIFDNAGIDRIEREKILAMFRSFIIHSPLKQGEDLLKQIFKSILLCSAAGIGGLSFLAAPRNALVQHKYLFSGLGVITAALLLSKPLAAGLLNYGLPLITSYNASAPNPYTILQKMEHLKRGYPQMSLLLVPHSLDLSVGNRGVDTFFKLFPVNDTNKYLVMSSENDHEGQTQEQLWARQAFRKKHGSSYYDFTEDLKKGSVILDNAQQGQAENIDAYIASMTSKNMATHYLRKCL